LGVLFLLYTDPDTIYTLLLTDQELSVLATKL